MYEQVCQIIKELKPALDPGASAPMISSGALDSFDLIMLIIDLGDAFGVSFLPADLVPENFDTVEAIVALISTKRTEEQ